MLKLLLVFFTVLTITPRYEQPLHVVSIRTIPLTEAQKVELQEAVYDALWYWRQNDHQVPNIVTYEFRVVEEISLHGLNQPNTLYLVQGVNDGAYYGNGVIIATDFWGGMPLAALLAHELGHSLYNYRDRYHAYDLEARYTDVSCRLDIMCNPIQAYLDSIAVRLPMVQ